MLQRERLYVSLYQCVDSVKLLQLPTLLDAVLGILMF